MKAINYFSWLTIVFITLSCSKNSSEEETTDGAPSINESISINSSYTNGNPEGIQDNGYNADDLLENSTFTTTVKITFGANVTIDNPLSGKGVTITTNNNDVIINSTVTEVAYEINGSTNDGSLKIYSDKKFKLTLNKASIKNNDGPAINIQSSKRAFVVLNDVNNLEDGSTYTSSTEDQKGTLFSEGQLIFSGQGTLTVNANNKHAIVSDDYIRFISGTIHVAKAKTDAIHSKDGIYIDGGKFDLKAESDGIEADKGEIIINNGEFKINVVDGGIVASWDQDNIIDPFIVINGGTFNIACSQGEGIESKSTLTINNGIINITANDDAINAGKAIYINNGTIVAYSKSNDGIDSNGILTITGGKTLAIGSRSPEAGFDCDNSTFKITGGWIVGLGGSTSLPTANVSSQASAILGTGQANMIYSLINDKNEELLTFKSPASFTTLLISHNKLTVNGNYSFVNPKNIINTEEFNGIYITGKLQNVSKVSTFTQSSLVTRIGGSTGPGGR